MTNYQWIIEAGGGRKAADAALVGDEVAVDRQLLGLIAAGATDVRAQPVAVGDNRNERAASLKRTRGELALDP